jgi:hypothetical protein
MKIYLDDDIASVLLVRLLGTAGHSLLTPSDFNLSGAKDPTHLHRSVLERAALLTYNYDDFKLLHDLVLVTGGHHFGILVVRKDNDPCRDLKPSGIVRAIRNLDSSGLSLVDQYVILNHWR